MDTDEYLKRNLLVAKAYGARAGIKTAMKRMEVRKDCPKWLVNQLQECIDRIEPLIPALVQHRGPSPLPPNK